ncbi:uncharacterized protein KY384_006772 [Bacidia gigantensis]|uniref:uncharacterized protein n=1 Tax=Bacidia gigantensis TaxID=2732470 RepID=UPI001D057025|nr:uncharacterized protein KY384_006772 [Bacidia gigantensis]KAG8527856.1 hypothetical protein KY384_006772 [Bacidia gigantensis]
MIDCSISHVDLHDIVKYEALSYVWADLKANKDIKCESEYLHITANLHAALKTLRYRSHPRFLLWPKFVAEERISMTWDALIPIPRQNWNALARLLRRPWFERVWIVQEAANAVQALVVNRDKQFPWDLITRGVEAIFHNNIAGLLSSERIRGLNTPINIKHIKSGYLAAAEHKLLAALIMTRALEATNKQDKLFGLLGLVGKEITSDLNADYSMSLEDVYRNLALFFLSKTGLRSLSSACAVPVTHEYQTPSWVPNWSFFYDTWTRNPHYYTASGRTVPEVSIDHDLLTLKGQFVDAIRGLGYEREAAQPLYTVPSVEFIWSTMNQEAIQMVNWLAMAFGEGIQISIIPPCQQENFLRTLVFNINVDGTEVRPELIPSILQYIETYQEVLSAETQNRFVELATRHRQQPGQMARVGRSLVVLSNSKLFCVTTKGRFGWTPNSAQVEDDVVLFHGADNPFVVRPLNVGPVKGLGDVVCYQIIGECYVHGIMKGEALQLDQSQAITLC